MTSKFSMRDIAERRAVASAIVTPLLKAKRDHTVLTAYQRVEPGPDGRVHTVLSPVGTSTFRLSSSESPFFESSTNLQNMAKKVARLDPLYQLRDVFLPDVGKVYVAGDYAGAEAVLVAAYSKDWPFLDKLLGGAKIHREHAQHFFDVDDPTKLQYDIAKTITYASFYRASPQTICERMNKDADSTGIRTTIEEVARLRAILLQLHPLEAWWDATRDLLDRNHGILRNCFGYRRVFRDPNPDYRLKDGLAFFPQSTVAWLINSIIATLYKFPFDATGNMLLQVHDELLFQTYPENVDVLIDALTPLYEQRFVIHGRELHIPVEWKVGSSWGQMKEWKKTVAQGA